MSYEGTDTSISKQNIQSDKTLKAVIDGKYYSERTKVKISSGLDYQQLDYYLRILNSEDEETKPVNSTSDMWSFYNNLSIDYDLLSTVSMAFKLNYNYYSISSLDSANQTGYTAERHELSFYGGIHATLLKKINLSFGLRKDHISELKTPFIYNLGLSYKPLDLKDLVFKASFARNFHNPSLNHLYWQPGGNPDLLPEEGYTSEAGIHHFIQQKSLSLESEFTVYYSSIDNWILWLPSFKGYWEAVNIREVKSYGFEIQTKLAWQTGKWDMKLIANYVYARSLNYGNPLVKGDESIGMQLPFIPVHSGNAFFSVQRKGYFVNYQYQYSGIRHLLSSNRIGLADDSEYFGADASENPFFRLYAQHLNHLSIGKSLKIKSSRLSLELKIHNLYNEVYRNILNRFMPRRHYTLMFKIVF